MEESIFHINTMHLDIFKTIISAFLEVDRTAGESEINTKKFQNLFCCQFSY